MGEKKETKIESTVNFSLTPQYISGSMSEVLSEREDMSLNWPTLRTVVRECAS